VNTAECPRCGKPCPIGPHSSAHCARCFSGFRIDTAQLVAAVDSAGQTIVRPDDRPRDTSRDDHEALSLFNAPRTMRGQTSLEGIE
jgi:hypothetical protein